jgi:hypothetical protein
MFVPNEITANVGDILEFHFEGPGKGVLGGNHSVAQGTWDRPCEPANSGFFSGYMPVNATSREAVSCSKDTRSSGRVLTKTRIWSSKSL